MHISIHVRFGRSPCPDCAQARKSSHAHETHAHETHTHETHAHETPAETHETPAEAQQSPSPSDDSRAPAAHPAAVGTRMLGPSTADWEEWEEPPDVASATENLELFWAFSRIADAEARKKVVALAVALASEREPRN